MIDDANRLKYKNKTLSWNADVHLLCTYCFLSNEEAQLFAAADQAYLIKDVVKYNFQNITGSNKVRLFSNGLVANWMFMLQRDDVAKRNQWSNYTNYPFLLDDQIDLPFPAPGILDPDIPEDKKLLISPEQYYGPGVNLYDIANEKYIGPTIDPNENSGYNFVPTNTYITGPYSERNQREILNNMGIVFDGEYRENVLNVGIYKYVEKYARTPGFTDIDGIYCYNFCLDTNIKEYQPSGAINLSKFNTIELEVNTITPPINKDRVVFNIICDVDGNPISATNKSGWDIYDYNYNLTVYEERYNIVSFIGGNCGLLYAK
jgi:hypothetical protein